MPVVHHELSSNQCANTAEIRDRQPGTLIELIHGLTPRFSSQQIKNELARLVADNLVTQQRADRHEGQIGAAGFLYSLPKREEQS